MKLDPKNRQFTIGRGAPITMTDVAHIELQPDEQVTFVTPDGHQYDVARKAWGFYATPSLNGRLLDFNLRAVVAKSPIGKYFVFLVERGREAQFEQYLADEENVIVRWLDNAEDLRAIETDAKVTSVPLQCMCRSNRFTTVHMYWEPPAGEVRYKSAPLESYRRELYRCGACGHYVSVFALAASFYQGEYVDATYGDAAGIRKTFDRIMALPPERSDNVGRVARINAFAGPAAGRSVLDVGSGLCVFLARMKQHGWSCTALDPDERAVRHARETVGIDGICGSLPLQGSYDVVTFNKVLEHVEDPVALLALARPLVRDFCYVELPDGEAAAREEGCGREEFVIEHFHVFSMASIALLAERAGFEVLELERLREPSTKYTLRAFLRPRKP